jgi:hypothetical protein
MHVTKGTLPIFRWATLGEFKRRRSKRIEPRDYRRVLDTVVLGHAMGHIKRESHGIECRVRCDVLHHDERAVLLGAQQVEECRGQGMQDLSVVNRVDLAARFTAHVRIYGHPVVTLSDIEWGARKPPCSPKLQSHLLRLAVPKLRTYGFVGVPFAC